LNEMMMIRVTSARCHDHVGDDEEGGAHERDVADGFDAAAVAV